MTPPVRSALPVVFIALLAVVLLVVGLTYRLTRDWSPVVVTREEVASSSARVSERLLETATSGITSLNVESRSAPPTNPVVTTPPSAPAIPTVAIPTMSIPPTLSMPDIPTGSVVTISPTWKPAIATVFWVGEGETSDNSYIHNRASAWDEDWVGTFGGVDDPNKRCGYTPCGFTPQQSPFYVALPYLEYTYDGYKKNVRDIPWYTKDALESDTLVHGHWVAVQHGSTTCYGQWRDTGPYETDDFAYVFGDAPTPRNKVGVGAGIDLSPALRDCLGVEDVSAVHWRFVDEAEVPEGPWRDGTTQ